MSEDLKLPEISEKDFLCLVETDDLIRRYGNPVLIRSEEKHELVCMAREYYERMVQERNQLRGEENIRYLVLIIFFGMRLCIVSVKITT